MLAKIALTISALTSPGRGPGVFPVCYSVKHFVNISLGNQHFVREQKDYSVRNFRKFTLIIVRYRSEALLVAHTTLLEISCHGSYYIHSDFKW